jgi:hypothetical protein
MKKQKILFFSLLLFLTAMASYYFFSMSASKQSYSYNKRAISTSEVLNNASNKHLLINPTKTALTRKKRIRSSDNSERGFYSNHFSGSSWSKSRSDIYAQNYLQSSRKNQVYSENNTGYRTFSTEKHHSNYPQKNSENVQANTIAYNFGSAFVRENYAQSAMLKENLFLVSNNTSTSNGDVMMRAANEDNPDFPGDPGELPITDGLYFLIALTGMYFLYIRQKNTLQSKTNSK